MLVIAIAASAPAAGVAAPAKTPDVTRLFDRALAKVTAKPDFARAAMLEADGATAGGRAVDSATGIVRWRFVLDNQRTRDTDFDSVTLRYSAPAGFGRPVGHPSPFLEDNRIRKAPKMTLAQAVTLLYDAGFGQKFQGVTLRSPLGPEATPPLYIFTLADGDFVGVNTKTGAVEPLSD